MVNCCTRATIGVRPTPGNIVQCIGNFVKGCVPQFSDTSENPLQRSVSGCRMILSNVERESCDSGINPLEFDPSWPPCAFLRSHLERITHGMAGTSKVENERQHGVCLSGSGPKGCSAHPVSPNHHNPTGGCNGYKNHTETV